MSTSFTPSIPRGSHLVILVPLSRCIMSSACMCSKMGNQLQLHFSLVYWALCTLLWHVVSRPGEPWRFTWSLVYRARLISGSWGLGLLPPTSEIVSFPGCIQENLPDHLCKYKLLLPLCCKKVGSTNQISERCHMTIVNPIASFIESFQTRPIHRKSQ